ncbi:glycosyl transferase [Rhodobacteraceae bacterium]|nr:glycosyl transferase [Paracoccaceae bacterium]
MIKQVICINWGTRYGPPFINRLYAMVARNITPPFSFTCFCDDPTGIRPEVDTQPLPELPIEVPKTKRGKWPKARLWGPELGPLTGNVLFIDLDVVITGSLDDLFSYGDPDQVILSRNAAKPFERIGQTSCFRFPVGKLVPLYEKFCANPLDVAEEYVFEQRFVSQCAPGGMDLFPRGWVQHFRYQCLPTWPLNWFRAAPKPRNGRVVIFPGGVHPQTAISGGWVGREGISLREHIANVADRPVEEGSAFRYLRHYTKPTAWVADAWRE